MLWLVPCPYNCAGLVIEYLVYKTQYKISLMVSYVVNQDDSLFQEDTVREQKTAGANWTAALYL